MNFERSSGILLHPTSLPGKFGIGTFGKEAYEFIDFLVKSGQKLWQTYPLGPTGYGDSPYQCFSAFAGNPLLIDLEKLVEKGYLINDDLTDIKSTNNTFIDYGQVINLKMPILKKSFENFKLASTELDKIKLENFFEKHKDWLEDYSLFMSLKDHFNGKAWIEWDHDIKLKMKKEVTKYKLELKDKIEFQNFVQFLFFDQWLELKSYANRNNIKIIGDIPIFVAFDSSDAWANSDIFLFDNDRKPISVAGVPPDYFSKTGQLWGNPLYDWKALEETNFEWWIKRIKGNLELSDIIRIDHFRGFAAYWEVPYGAKTAIGGKWIPAPGKKLFEAIENSLGKLPIIAEDLGVITPDVEELRDHFDLPGMKILQFAFTAGEESDYLPHNYPLNCVVYTGTHDNDTTKGWFKQEQEDNKKYIKEYLNTDASDICWDFIRAAWASTAVMAIAPLQDLLELGSEARINTPGKADGNWQWRYKTDDLKEELATRINKMTNLYFR